jgi:hypothetical protein
MLHRSIILVAALTLVSPAMAVDYFPIVEGVVWTYHSSSPQWDDQYTTHFAGTEVVNGVTAKVMRFAGGQDEGLQQFWTDTPEGDKFIHGWSLGDGLRNEFIPPLLDIDSPLFLGKTWDVATVGSLSGPLTVHYTVVAAGPVTVPAGTFEAFAIDTQIEWPLAMKAPGISLFGTVRTASVGEPYDRRMYADGIGLIGWSSGWRVDELLDVDATVGVSAATWTAIRQFYR